MNALDPVMVHPRLIMSLYVALLLAGCARHRGDCPCPSHADAWSHPAAPLGAISDLPAVGAEEARYEVPELPTGDAMRVALTAAESEADYRRIGRDQAACQAAAHSPLANLLVSEQDAIWVAQWCDEQRSCRGPLERELLVLQAREERNQAASRALLLFYGLAEAEAGQAALVRSHKILAGTIRDLKLMQAQGLETGIDEPTLIGQQLDLHGQRDELNQTIDRLNDQLAAVLGLPASATARVWPDARLDVVAELPSLESGLATASAHRADLVMLRRLREDLNADTVAAARGALAAITPSLGVAPMTASILQRWTLCACQSCEEPIRRRQIDAILADREAAVAAEVRQAWHALAAALRSVALSGDKRSNSARQLDNIQALRRSGASTPWAVASAELELIQAESELMRRIMALRRAEVDYERTQGVLATGCGFDDE